MLIPILLSLIIVFIFSYLWANTIDKMHREHPDYKGEDFLNFSDRKPDE